VQYASHDYVALSRTKSGSARRAPAIDNATCESFIKTLKCEEVYRSEYRNLAEAHARIGEFLDEIYNQKRLHSSLGYCAPAEFERFAVVAAHAGGGCGAGGRLSFLRRGEIYPCDEGTISRPRDLATAPPLGSERRNVA
jgi:Integrase core domain